MSLTLRTDSPQLNAELYIRRKEGCSEIDTRSGLKIYELLGEKNGNSSNLSVALEEFAPQGSSHPHFHSKRDEYQVCLEGQGKLIIGNETRTVTPGDLVKIPKGKVHQTINEHQVPLKLYCFLTPSWSFEDATFVDRGSSQPEEKGEIYMRKKEGCDKINAGRGEAIYELLGKENGSSDDLSIALVEIEEGCASEAHYHPESDESYLILEGQGRLIVDGQTRIVTPGDLAKIPMGKVHQIFNDKKDLLKFYCACTPAWVPSCMIKV